MHTPVNTMASCTVRIVGITGGVETSVGTGFFYGFALYTEDTPPQDAKFIPALITNKHVLDGCDQAQIVVTAAASDAGLDEDGFPQNSVYRTFLLDVAQFATRHPSSDVDLCALNIAGVLNQLNVENLVSRHAFLSASYQMQREVRLYTRAVESIAMVGYPRGLWDSKNNLPIVRRGSTATHPFVAYEGRQEFLIDAACFPGSSGSPVFLFEDGTYRSGATSYTPGTRIALLGVLYAGPQFDAQGRLEQRPIPHSVSPTPITSIPMNLGFVIQARQIDALGEVMIRKAGGMRTLS